jgi:hypothetical protein
MANRFLISHLFFFTALLALLGALILALTAKNRRGKSILLAALPIGLIFLTAYLGKHLPWGHHVVNVVYDGLMIYNAYYFFKTGPVSVFYCYAAALVSTVLDFAMHFVISAM